MDGYKHKNLSPRITTNDQQPRPQIEVHKIHTLLINTKVDDDDLIPAINETTQNPKTSHRVAAAAVLLVAVVLVVRGGGGGAGGRRRSTSSPLTHNISSEFVTLLLMS